MIKLLSIAKWMAGHSRPFVFSLLLIMIPGVILSFCRVGMAVVSKELVDSAAGGERYRVILAAVAFAVLILLRVGLQAASSVMSIRTLEALSNSIRQRVFSHLSRTIWTDYSRIHSGDLMTRLTSDVGHVANGLVYVLPDIISLGVQLTAAFTVLFIFDPALAILAFILGPAAILFSRFLGRRLKQLHIKIQESESTCRSYLHEILQNMPVIKTFCREEVSAQHVGTLQTEKLSLVTRRSRLCAVAGSALSLGYWTGYFLAFVWGAFRLSAGAATFGTIAAFLQLVEQIQGPFIGLAYTLPQIVSTAASAGRLMELEAWQLENTGGIVPSWPSAGICFENVSFAYEENKPVLSRISASIFPGETVAIMGPSGEGKTTLVRLILSLVQSTGGCICFTGPRSGKQAACAAARSLISYVPQGNTLFSGTIAENLRIGNPDASEQELEKAARAACAWEFIEKLPGRFDTKIGEKGLGLSEGQAQRLAIARAFLRKAPVLVLDEATSALDMETEKYVLQAIQNLNPKRTCIIVTHRSSALEVCGRVFKLVDGRLEEIARRITEAPASEAV